MDLLDIGIYLAYALVFVAVVSMIVLPLINALKSPGDLAKSGMGVGALVVLFAIAFAISGGELTPQYQALGVETEFSSRLIGAGLTMFYFVFFIAVLGIIYSEINKALK
ncbi:MAG TPA: hypothetical protein VG737_02050 [Cyclobacteriaceae bacterium]|nr:hypothetical protein [Cyclobacteriaceae bacterium]